MGCMNEQAFGFGAGDFGFAAAEDFGAGANEWLCDQFATEAGFWGRVAGERRVALPCPAQAGAGRLDHGGVEAYGE